MDDRLWIARITPVVLPCLSSCHRGGTFDNVVRQSKGQTPTWLGVEAKIPAPRDGRLEGWAEPVAQPATLRSRRGRPVTVFGKGKKTSEMQGRHDV